MNLEELAREAEVWAIPGAILPPSKVHNERLTRFAALVLEEAARECDAEFWRVTKARGGDAAVAAGECAAAIRALKPVAS